MLMPRGWFAAMVCMALSSCAVPVAPVREEPAQNSWITAEYFDAGFYAGDSNYKGVIRASDGKIYYVICCHRIDTHAQMFVMDPATRRVSHVADLGGVVGDLGKHAVPHGKVHVNLFEDRGKLYTATHIGYYKPVSAVEEPGRAEGYRPYPGGHFISYDLASGSFQDLARAPEEEGIITMIMDKERQRLYGLTWPGGLFLYYDLSGKTLKNCGPVFGRGERGKDSDWMLLCRTFALDPRDGSVYWSNTRGEIGAYRYGLDALEVLKGCTLDLGSSGGISIWRSIVWVPREQAFYGLHSGRGHLFRFDPRAERVEPLTRLCPEPYRQSGESGQPALAFQLGPDGETLYYLTTGPAPHEPDGRKIRSAVHLITYHIPSGTYRDHGRIRLEDGRYPLYVQSIAVADGYVYAVPWIEVVQDGSARVRDMRKAREGNITQAPGSPLEEINLIRFPDPLFKK